MTVEWESTHGKGDVQKTALIAGGAKGIGREVGLRLAERGWARADASVRTAVVLARIACITAGPVVSSVASRM